MLFRDRSDAAEKLSAALAAYKGKHALILGVPRGAVPMARTIAERLDGEVDVVLVRKLRAPGNPEYAIGSVDESGWSFVTGRAAAAGATEGYIEAEKKRQLEIIQERRAAYTEHRPQIDPAGRIVIVVDDGLATGSTMIAALHALRARKPQRLVCAVPVAPPETLDRIRSYCDEVVCLDVPKEFYAVGQFYSNFPQVDDTEVVHSLR
ncbi:MAG: phosphoribosyltransferase [Burkholderiales bacterium]